MQRRQLYRQLGHASLELYATQSLGFSRNRYWQFKRLADDLDRLPALKEAVIAGDLGWTKAQQVARVATEETQEAWVAKAATSSRRVLEQEVRRARKRPSPAPVVELAFQAPSEPAAGLPVTVSLRMTGVQLARFEALVEKVRKLKVVPEGADRVDLLLASLECTVASASAAGEGPRAAGPAVQIVVQQCPDCANAGVVTSRGERRLAPAQLDALGCDARVRRAGGTNRATIPPSVRAAVLARDRHRCATPGCGSTSFLEVHHVTPRCEGGSNQAENLVSLCSRCHGFVHEHERRVAPAQSERAGPPAGR
jgi:5-methylcytosine-specific restriction endonuclease McrA